jgi:hypothetical protein
MLKIKLSMWGDGGFSWFGYERHYPLQICLYILVSTLIKSNTLSNIQCDDKV